MYSIDDCVISIASDVLAYLKVHGKTDRKQKLLMIQRPQYDMLTK